MTDESFNDPNYHVPPPRPQTPAVLASMTLDNHFNPDGTIKVPA